MSRLLSPAVAFSVFAAVAGPSHAADLGLRLASLDSAEVLEHPSWGDRMTVSRPFGPWTLICELSVSQNRRLCSVEQSLKASGGAVYWKLGQAEDNRTVLIVSLPPNLDTGLGLAMRFGGVSADVTAWACTPKACIAFVLLNKTLETLLLTSDAVEFGYQTKAGASVKLNSALAGLQVALKAAANDPFGKQEPVRKAATIPVPSPRPDMIAMQEASNAGR